MHSSQGESSSDGNAILDILLQLSNAPLPPWKPQFPYMDPTTAAKASQSIATIISEDKTKLRKQTILLVRKLCSGSGTFLDVDHGSWIGRSLSTQQAISCLLDICSLLISDEEEWAARDTEQHLAISYALLSAAMHKPRPFHSEAGSMCAQIVNKMLDVRELSRYHHRYLAQVWEYSAELPFDFNLLVKLAERSSLGLEQSLLWLGKIAISGDYLKMEDALETSLVSVMIRACSQSPLAFQTVSNILAHMMVVSEAHCGIQKLTTSLIGRIESECSREGCDASALYEEPVQVFIALLCIDPALLPKKGMNILSQEYILKKLLGLPHIKVALVLSHKPSWLPFITSELNILGNP